MTNTPAIPLPFKVAHDRVPIRALHASDWREFRDWARQIAQSHGMPAEAFERIDTTPEKTWQTELEQADWKFFAAFSGEKIIGLGRVTARTHLSNAHEVNLEIAADWQGRGIGTDMYVAMKSHIAGNGAGTDMAARILATNLASQRSAEKAGLVFTGQVERIPHGGDYRIYRAFRQSMTMELAQKGPQAI